MVRRNVSAALAAIGLLAFAPGAGAQVGDQTPAEAQPLVVVVDSAGAAELFERRIGARGFDSAEAGLRAVSEGRIEAFVHDRPLPYVVRESYQGDIEVLPDELGRQDYGIALPQGASLREPLNRALLAAVRSPRWEDILGRYLGRDE